MTHLSVSMSETLTQDRITIQEASKALNIGRKTIYRWIDKGLVSREREGNRAYVSLSEVKAQYDKEHVKEHSGNTADVSGNIPGTHQDTKTVTLDREHYEGLLIRLGQLESEKRYLLEYKGDIEEKDRELERLKVEVERLKVPWWKRLFSPLK